MISTESIQNAVRVISLTRGFEAIVDAEDFEWLSQWKWTALCRRGRETIYAYRHLHNGRRYAGCVLMHRQIIGILGSSELRVDHINHNGLDNRRRNLRIATQQQNLWNARRRKTSVFKGVRKRHNRNFQAYIKLGGRFVTIGSFLDAEEAARAYDKVARENFGEFACCNFEE